MLRRNYTCEVKRCCGMAEARGGCCAGLGLSRQLSGVGDAKFKVTVGAR